MNRGRKPPALLLKRRLQIISVTFRIAVLHPSKQSVCIDPLREDAVRGGSRARQSLLRVADDYSADSFKPVGDDGDVQRGDGRPAMWVVGMPRIGSSCP